MSRQRRMGREEFLRELRDLFIPEEPPKMSREETLEVVTVLQGYWDKKYLQEYLAGGGDQWLLIRDACLEDLYVLPEGKGDDVRAKFQQDIVALALRWARMGGTHKPLPISNSANSRLLWAAMYPHLPTYGELRAKDLDPRTVLGDEVIKRGKGKVLEDANLVELLTNMWMLCLLSPGQDEESVQMRTKVLQDLKTLEDLFFAPLERKKYWEELACACVFLETRPLDPNSKFSRIINSLDDARKKKGNSGEDSLDDAKQGESSPDANKGKKKVEKQNESLDEKFVLDALKEFEKPNSDKAALLKDDIELSTLSDWQGVRDIKIVPLQNIFDDFLDNVSQTTTLEARNHLEVALARARPWIWGVALGIAAHCTQQTDLTKNKKIATVATTVGTVLGVVGAIAGAAITGGASLLLIPKMIASIGVRSAVTVGIVSILGAVTGFGFKSWLQNSSYLSNEYRKLMLETVAQYNKEGATRLEKAPLSDIEGCLIALLNDQKKISEEKQKLRTLAKILYESRNMQRFNVGVMGQPDVGKSEFLHTGRGFRTNPGTNKPTTRLMQYIDNSKICWFDFPGLDDMSQGNGTVLHFQIEAKLMNMLVVVWKAGNRDVAPSLQNYLAQENNPPIVMCYNQTDLYVSRLLQKWTAAMGDPFEFVCRKLDKFDKKMRKTYSTSTNTVKTVYTCFIKVPNATNEVLWARLISKYNILNAAELSEVISTMLTMDYQL